MEKIYFSEYRKGDDLSALRNAVDSLKNKKNCTLVIEPGEYILTDLKAKQLQEDIMYGKYTQNSEPIIFNKNFHYQIGLNFSGVEDATIEAYGVVFYVDGFMETISLQYCKNITVTGLTLDCLRKPYSKGEIVNYSDAYTDIIFQDTRLINPIMPAPRINIYSKSERRFTQIYSTENKQQLSENIIRFHGFSCKNIGDEAYITHTYHYRPSILIYEAENINLRDITIHSHPGMGIVGHRSKNITLTDLKVIPSLGHAMSTNTDATHFTSCTGVIKFEGCHFDGHGDDATNVHTYYHTILSHNKNSCTTTVMAPTGTHAQKPDYPDPGDILEYSSPDDLSPKEKYTVVSSVLNHDTWECSLILDRDLPEDCKGQYLANITQLPKLRFINCFCRNHLARSVLVKTRDVLIEGCSFENSTGTAIHVAAEGYWQEGITSENVTIKNNRFMFCGKVGHGRIFDAGAISINILAPNAKKPVHKNIVIENNHIDCPDTKHAIYAQNVDELTIKNNKLRSKENPLEIKYCANVISDIPY